MDKIKLLSGKPSLLKALFQTFWPEYLLTGAILFVENIFRIMQPLMLGELLDYFRPGTTKTENDALIYAVAVVLLNGAVVLLINQYYMQSFHYGMKVRAACCALIYRKVCFKLVPLGWSAQNIQIFLPIYRIDVLPKKHR